MTASPPAAAGARRPLIRCLVLAVDDRRGADRPAGRQDGESTPDLSLAASSLPAVRRPQEPSSGKREQKGGDRTNWRAGPGWAMPPGSSYRGVVSNGHVPGGCSRAQPAAGRLSGAGSIARHAGNVTLCRSYGHVQRS